MRRVATSVVLSSALVLGEGTWRLSGVAAENEAAVAEWPAYGGDLGNGRYSALAEINRQNVSKLTRVWTYHTRESEPEFQTKRPKFFQATPLVVDGRMYLSTPLARVIALDPETGRELWAYDPGIDRDLGNYGFINRGLATWLDPAAPVGAPCRRRLIVGTTDGRLVAIDAADGKPCADFGVRGGVDVREGLRNPPTPTEYALRSPAVVLGGVVVIGSTVHDNQRVDGPSGAVQGYDARTGRRRWLWDPIPQDPSDPAFAGWEPEQARRTGHANAWGLLAADAKRDIVVVGTSSPSPDEYGVLRQGSNLYANSVVALRASTGQRVWHYQLVHHDLWDYDVITPTLVEVRREGKQIPAVLVPTKSNQLFLLHRETGQPLFPVEERRVATSTVPGEVTWPTQPFSSLPPLGPQSFSAEQAWGPTPADREACREKIAGLRNEGMFTPPSLEGTLLYPSHNGGAEWGGAAYDARREVAVVPVNRSAAEVKLVPRAGLDEAGESSPMRGGPYVMRRSFLTSPSGLPCVPPPFGALVAVSLQTGKKLWEVPLGKTGDHPGSQNAGGPIVTAGGLVFVGGTQDRQFRAFDVESGQELWSAGLSAGSRATPMTYRLKPGGRQYVVVAAGGGAAWGDGDELAAFALPDPAPPSSARAR